VGIGYSVHIAYSAECAQHQHQHGHIGCLHCCSRGAELKKKSSDDICNSQKMYVRTFLCEFFFFFSCQGESKNAIKNLKGSRSDFFPKNRPKKLFLGLNFRVFFYLIFLSRFWAFYDIGMPKTHKKSVCFSEKSYQKCTYVLWVLFFLSAPCCCYGYGLGLGHIRCDSKVAHRHTRGGCGDGTSGQIIGAGDVLVKCAIDAPRAVSIGPASSTILLDT
jgi:hypothetical protein